MSQPTVVTVGASTPTVVTCGADMFADSVAGQAVDVERVDWRPPMPGTEADLATVATDPRRHDANLRAVEAMLGVTAHLVDVAPASEVLGLEKGQFLHAGPPIEWERTSGPLRGALMGGAALEGLVDDPEDAAALFESGSSVSLEPCHHRSAVGPMAGVVTPSMWMWVLEDRATGRRTYCSLNEGLGKVLRYGAYSPEVLTRLRWMGDVLGPLLQAAVRGTEEATDVTGILTQMLQMGDEAHNRNRAGTLMLLRDLSPALVSSGSDAGFDSVDVADVLRFVGGNDHFFLNLAMPACKLALDAGRDVPGSTMVVAMARNGTDFGIQVSGTGDEWFTGPAQVAEGLFLGDYGPDDANADIGDSAITETAGIGGFAMATAPAIVRLVGGTVPDALATTRRMHEITLAENPRWSVPVLEFMGTPTGIDVTKVCRTGILPQINTGMAGKVAGVGQVGAGLVTPPAEIFPKALAALARPGRSGRGGRPLVVDAGRLLAGEARDGAHDPVGQVTTRPAARHAVVLVRDGDRLADPHGDVDLAQPRAVGADRLDLLGPQQADRQDRAAGGEGEVRHAGTTAVEPAVTRAGALGVDAERLPAPQHLERGVEAGDRRLGVVPVDRQHAEPLEPRADQRALHPGAGEVVGLGEEDDLARDDDRDDDAVEEGQVVARHDDGSGGGHVVQPLDRWAPHGTGERGDDSVRDRVEHGSHSAPRRGDQNARVRSTAPLGRNGVASSR